MISIALGCLFAIATAVMLRFPIAPFVAGAVGAALPGMFLRHRRSGRFRRFEEQFPEALDLLSRAIRAGHLHSIVNGIASPGWLDFTATSSSGIALEGDELQLRQIHGSDPRGGPPGGPVVLRVRTNAPPPFTTSGCSPSPGWRC